MTGGGGSDYGSYTGQNQTGAKKISGERTAPSLMMAFICTFWFFSSPDRFHHVFALRVFPLPIKPEVIKPPSHVGAATFSCELDTSEAPLCKARVEELGSDGG